MTMTNETAAGYVPAAVPALDLEDTGQWREAGVTHWHLVRDEIATHDRLRYTAERWHGLAGARFSDHTADPAEALSWLANERMAAIHRTTHPEATAARAGMGSERDWIERHETTWHMLTLGRSAGGGIAISDGRSVDLFAEPMTARTCAKH